MLGRCYLYALETLYDLYTNLSTGSVTLGGHSGSVIFDAPTAPYARIGELGCEPRLVHGPIIGDFGELMGKKFEHAWIEGNGFVLDCGSVEKEYTLVSGPYYYEYWRINSDECRRYTIHEATGHVIATGRDHGWNSAPA
jgi:hypothetical protein